jgi:hypothetical protein
MSHSGVTPAAADSGLRRRSLLSQNPASDADRALSGS